MLQVKYPLRRCPSGKVFRKAFTLLEMLIVLVIIVVMASLLVPSMGRSLRLARDAVCKNRLHQIGTALQVYRAEHDGWLPATSADNFSSDEAEPWFSPLFPDYLSDPMILTCREDPYWYRMERAKEGEKVQKTEASDYASYGLNAFMALSEGSYLLNLDRNPPKRLLDNILVSDTGPDYHFGGTAGSIKDGPKRNRGLLMLSDGSDPVSGQSGVPSVTVRHNTGINVLCIQGNVREARTKKLLESPVLSYYSNCAKGGCTICNWEDRPVPHYSFAQDQLFWWTGSLSVPPTR